MSQAGRPRPRHIAFRLHVDGPVARRDMGQALGRLAATIGIPDGRVRLTRFEAPHGIVSTDHRHDRALRDALGGLTRVAGLAARVETLSSSGTIKTLTDRLGMLADRGPRPAKGSTGGRGKQGASGGSARTPQPQAARAAPRDAPRAMRDGPRPGSGGPASVPGREAARARKDRDAD